MTLRLDDEQDAELTALAVSQGVSKNEAALRAIRAAADRERRAALLDTAITDTASRYATTLERLGE